MVFCFVLCMNDDIDEFGTPNINSNYFTHMLTTHLCTRHSIFNWKETPYMHAEKLVHNHQNWDIQASALWHISPYLRRMSTPNMMNYSYQVHTRIRYVYDTVYTKTYSFLLGWFVAMDVTKIILLFYFIVFQFSLLLLMKIVEEL